MNAISIEISNQVDSLLDCWKAPETLGFGSAFLPIMATCEYRDGAWGHLKLGPYESLKLDPSMKVLHYGQEIFEGMKVSRHQGPARIFRLNDHFLRMNRSAAHMMMPALPEAVFKNAVQLMSHYGQRFIPVEPGTFLYLRPFMLATEPALGINASSQYLFCVIASPCAPLGKKTGITLYIERLLSRAVRGGIGSAKTGGNYAASLMSASTAAQKGCAQVLWLDAIEKQWIEECSGSNFFAVIDGTLCTPVLTDTILDGITRRSILALAQYRQVQVLEMSLSINELITDIKNGRCTEMFICGTAFSITPVNALMESTGETFELSKQRSSIGTEIAEVLLAIHRGTAVDVFQWTTEIETPERLAIVA